MILGKISNDSHHGSNSCAKKHECFGKNEDGSQKIFGVLTFFKFPLARKVDDLTCSLLHFYKKSTDNL